MMLIISVPPNMEFQIDDFEQEWTFRNESFDMIHSRLLLASVSDYPKLLRKAFRYSNSHADAILSPVVEE